MKTDKNILIAFILNLAFSVFELVGGIITGSVAIASDAIHDLGDAASIGISYALERKSKKQPNDIYTCTIFRYRRSDNHINSAVWFCYGNYQCRQQNNRSYGDQL